MGTIISDSENVIRILRRDWFDDGKLMHIAFALRKGETYLSVNRTAVDSFRTDVSFFVKTHPDYMFGDSELEYCCANLNVGEVRNTYVTLDERNIDIDVEVEPRNAIVKSHAGIFVRYGNMYLKMGSSIVVEDGNAVVSVDDILLKVRLQLLRKARCQRIKLGTGV